MRQLALVSGLFVGLFSSCATQNAKSDGNGKQAISKTPEVNGERKGPQHLQVDAKASLLSRVDGLHEGHEIVVTVEDQSIKALKVSGCAKGGPLRLNRPAKSVDFALGPCPSDTAVTVDLYDGEEKSQGAFTFQTEKLHYAFLGVGGAFSMGRGRLKTLGDRRPNDEAKPGRTRPVSPLAVIGIHPFGRPETFRSEERRRPISLALGMPLSTQFANSLSLLAGYSPTLGVNVLVGHELVHRNTFDRQPGDMQPDDEWVGGGSFSIAITLDTNLLRWP